jgi:hypothetical protein
MLGPMGGARLWNVAAALAGAGALAGCRAGYDVEVRNRTDRVVVARVLSERAGEEARAVSTRYIHPGARGTLLVRTDKDARLALEVSEPGRQDPWPSPARLELDRGRMVVGVRREGEERFLLERAR